MKNNEFQILLKKDAFKEKLKEKLSKLFPALNGFQATKTFIHETTDDFYQDLIDIVDEMIAPPEKISTKEYEDKINALQKEVSKLEESIDEIKSIVRWH